MAEVSYLFNYLSWQLTRIIFLGVLVYLTGLSRQRGILGNTEATWGNRPSFLHRQPNGPKRQSTRQC